MYSGVSQVWHNYLTYLVARQQVTWQIGCLMYCDGKSVCLPVSSRIHGLFQSSLLKESAARPMKGLQGMATLAANLSGKLGGDSTKHPKGESKFLVSTAKADAVKPSLPGKSDTSKFSTSAFSRLEAPKSTSSFSAKLDASKPRSSEPAKVVKSLSSSSTGRMSQSSMMSADKRFAMMKKKAQKKLNERKSSLKWWMLRTTSLVVV